MMPRPFPRSLWPSEALRATKTPTLFCSARQLDRRLRQSPSELLASPLGFRGGLLLIRQPGIEFVPRALQRRQFLFRAGGDGGLLTMGGVEFFIGRFVHLELFA